MKETVKMAHKKKKNVLQQDLKERIKLTHPNGFMLGVP